MLWGRTRSWERRLRAAEVPEVTWDSILGILGAFSQRLQCYHICHFLFSVNVISHLRLILNECRKSLR
jgi:hypothetical protein